MLLTMMLLISLLLIPSSATQTQAQPIKLASGGLIQPQVLSIGRDKTFRNLTVTMTIENKGKNTIYVLLIPADFMSPKAVDNTGANFRFVSGSGIAICPDSVTRRCIGEPVNPSITPPLQSWTELDPDNPITLNFALTTTTSEESHGPLVSFSSLLAYRVVSDPVQDDLLSDTQKRQQIHTRSFGTPMTHVTQQP